MHSPPWKGLEDPLGGGVLEPHFGNCYLDHSPQAPASQSFRIKFQSLVLFAASSSPLHSPPSICLPACLSEPSSPEFVSNTLESFVLFPQSPLAWKVLVLFHPPRGSVVIPTTRLQRRSSRTVLAQQPWVVALLYR